MAVEHSYGDKLEYADDSGFSTNLVEVTNITMLDGEDLVISKVKTTHLRSTDGYHERVAGLLEEADFNADVNYDEAKFSALSVIARAKTTKYWRRTLPGGSTLTGQGFIHRLGLPRSNEDGIISHRLVVSPLSKWAFTQV